MSAMQFARPIVHRTVCIHPGAREEILVLVLPMMSVSA